MLLVKNVNPEKCTAQVLATLFGVYGIVNKVQLIKVRDARARARGGRGSVGAEREGEGEGEDEGEGEGEARTPHVGAHTMPGLATPLHAQPEQSAVVEMASSEMASCARQFLDGCPLFFNNLSVVMSPEHCKDDGSTIKFSADAQPDWPHRYADASSVPNAAELVPPTTTLSVSGIANK